MSVLATKVALGLSAGDETSAIPDRAASADRTAGTAGPNATNATSHAKSSMSAGRARAIISAASRSGFTSGQGAVQACGAAKGRKLSSHRWPRQIGGPRSDASKSNGSGSTTFSREVHPFSDQTNSSSRWASATSNSFAPATRSSTISGWGSRVRAHDPAARRCIALLDEDLARARHCPGYQPPEISEGTSRSGKCSRIASIRGG